MEHYVYILISETFGVYYKGYTQNLNKRLWEHNNGSSRYTKDKGPWRLVFTHTFKTKREALIFENRIKRLNKQSLEKLINEGNQDGSVG